jgi:hypothetical protein
MSDFSLARPSWVGCWENSMRFTHGEIPSWATWSRITQNMLLRRNRSPKSREINLQIRRKALLTGWKYFIAESLLVSAESAASMVAEAVDVMWM